MWKRISSSLKFLVLSLNSLAHHVEFFPCFRAEGVAIDMAEIYYNFWYRNQSFVILNEASVAMEFLLSSTLDHNDSTELNFSLENSSLKRFSSVTVDAKSR